MNADHFMLSKFLGLRRRPPASSFSVPEGRRIYAIGDVHGRLDLLDELLAKIDTDDAQRSAADTTLILLGDLVDRGPDSAGVVERLRLRSERQPNMRFLKGNHEEVFLTALTGDLKALKFFCRIGGRETIISYGLSTDDYEQMDYETLSEWLVANIPASHQTFIADFEDMVVLGDYAFVHAGIRPGVPLDAQTGADLRWIRNPFLDHRGLLEKRIVHGHTIQGEITVQQHRIGLDTGAYAGGPLSAIGMESGDIWHLQT